MAAEAVMAWSFRGLVTSAEGMSRGAQERAPKTREVKIRPGDLGEGCKLRKCAQAKPRMKTASGEFRYRFFGFFKISYMVWSRDSQLTTNVKGDEVKGQKRDPSRAKQIIL